MCKRIAAAVATTVAVPIAAALPARAAIAGCTSIAGFLAAAGPAASEGFDGVASDKTFAFVPLDVGAFSISHGGIVSAAFYFIDVLPFTHPNNLFGSNTTICGVLGQA